VFARERAEKYISLCNPSPAPFTSRRRKKRISMNATARRGASWRRDCREIPAVAQESLFPPFAQQSYDSPETRGAFHPFAPDSLRPLRDTTNEFTFRGPDRVLQSPGSICLALSSTPLLANPLACRPPLLQRQTYLTLSATQTASEGFSSDINRIRIYRDRVNDFMYTSAWSALM